MIRFQKLTLTDFGPFLGQQELVFPDSGGVVVVYGANGKGKTSLLNAFRWVFTGKVVSRSGERDPGQLINTEAISRDSDAGCKAKLDFVADGKAYEVTRYVEVSNGLPTQRVLLTCDGTSVSAANAERELARILPPEVQQFFFFDGELLDQFEGLLRDDTVAGDHLKGSIERLLGVPVVVNATVDCEAAAAEATSKLAEAAKLDKDSQQAGTALGQAQVLHGQAQQRVKAEKERIEELEAEFQAVEDKLSKQQRSSVLMGTLDAKRDDRARLLQEFASDDESLRIQLDSAWKAVAAGPLTERLEMIQAEIERVLAKRNRAAFASELRAAAAASEKECPACGTGPLDKKHRRHLKSMTEEADRLDDLDHELATLRRERTTLSALQDPGSVDRIRTAETQWRRRKVDLGDVEARIEELVDQLHGVDQKGVAVLARRHSEITTAIEQAKRNLSAAAGEVESHSQTMQGLERRLAAFAERNIEPAVRHQGELGRRLSELFQRGVEEYRGQLLRAVERAASDLFVRMRSEPDFTGLSINDSYGLNILDPQGEVVNYRSAGYEHLVALALIGGLQECSTIEGPVLMDSPFGRLDPDHVQQVAGHLDKLSPQVILLVHEGEIDPVEAPALLGGKLLIEYELRRHSSTNTEIAERRAS